ncbi:MAG: DoxX family protein [Allosphingosinicella sp.]
MKSGSASPRPRSRGSSRNGSRTGSDRWNEAGLASADAACPPRGCQPPSAALGAGAFLIWQSHDNILSSARMDEFEAFLAKYNFVMPELMAPLCVWAQLLCGLAILLGFLTRWAGLVTAFTFIVAVWMVNWPQDFPGWWPALILVFLGLLFATLGAGRYSIDALLERRSDRDRTETAAPR